MRIGIVFDDECYWRAFEWKREHEDSGSYADIDVELWDRYLNARREWSDVQRILDRLPLKWEQDET